MARALGFTILLFGSTALAAPTVDKSSVPADAPDTAHVNIDAFGRYAITTQSKTGVALQIVDRVAGPGPVHGRAGEEDGRLDAFFDRGTYRIKTFGDPRAAKGKASLRVHAFAEKNAPAPPKIVEHKPIDTTLGDFEQRSYWVEITQRRWVAFEAAGRNLSDLRLWKDGTWLVDRTPESDTTEPKTGRPLAVRRLTADLEPGLYLLTAYGGAPRAWADDDKSHPFHLRFGIPSLPSVLRKRMVIGPLGYDRFVVSGASYYRVELAEALDLGLEVGHYQPQSPWSGDRRTAITKKSVPPVAEIFLGSDNSARVVTVRGPAGRPYLLQHFDQRRSVTLPRGEYYVATVHSGHPADELDASGIVVRNKEPYNATVWQAPRPADGDGWARRFNLLDKATILLDIHESGTYRLVAGGDARADFRLEPFFVSPPKDYRTPKTQKAPATWTVDRGLYVLTMYPDKKGVIEVALSRDGIGDRLGRVFGSKTKIAVEPPRPAVRFERFAAPSDGLSLYVNEQPGVRTGILARKLPLDLRDPLSIALRPNEIATLSTNIEEEGVLYAEAEDGARLLLSVDGGSWGTSLRPSVGRHEVRVKGAPGISVSTVGLKTRRLEPDTPLPAMPDARLANIPKLPRLSDTEPVFFDLARSSQRSYLVEATATGLYQLESTGLLATEGRLRTRVVPSLVTVAQNGVGRNFLVQQYLGVGSYQLTVGTQGRSKGHLGVRLKRTKESRRAPLIDGVPARATIHVGETLVYPFEIEEAGSYRLRAFGQGRTLKARLEDSEGWPLVTPNVDADFDRRFEKGRYRLIVLPESVDVRVVTLLERHQPPLTFEGHGPHTIPLNRQIEHTWVRRGDDTDKDVWSFEVPADVDVKLELGGKMHGDLFREGQREKVAYVPPLRGWSGALAKGRYRLEIENLQKTTDVPYALAVRTVQLVVGQTWNVRAPQVLPLAIGTDEVVEINSFGGEDVAARLIDADGRVVARSDDRPDDWNFLLARRLAAGRYTLRIDPVAGRRARTRVRVLTRAAHASKPFAVPGTKTVNVEDRREVIPLTLPEGARFLVVWARSPETTAIAVEENVGGWRAVAQHVGRPARIEVPLALGAKRDRYRVNVWSTEERGAPVELEVHAVAPEPISEAKLARGHTVSRIGRLPIGLAAVALETPGSFTFDEPENVRWADRAAAAAPDRGLAHPAGRQLWIVHALDTSKRGTVRGKRVTLDDGTLPIVIDDQGVRVDVGDDAMVVATIDTSRSPLGLAVLGPKQIAAPRHWDVSKNGRAAAVSLGGRGRGVRVWSATSGVDAFDATLRVARFDEVEKTTATRGSVAPGAAVILEKKAGASRHHVLLTRGGIAAIANGDEVQRVVLAGDVPERFDGDSDRVVVFNPSTSPVEYAIDVVEAGDARVPYERMEVTNGRFELTLPAVKNARRLRVVGAESVTWFGADGKTATGDTFDVPGVGGVVRIVHGAETVLAWTDVPEHPYGALFDRDPAAKAVEAPGSVALSGRAMAFDLTSKSATLFEVRADVPVVARWETPGAAPQVVVGRSGLAMPLFLASGRGRLSIRAVGGGPLFGRAAFVRTEVPHLEEGIGPQVVIGPGHARAFTFDVKDATKIGVGLRASDAEVRMVLLDPKHGVIGDGVAQMPKLEAGTYVLLVYTGERVARVRPAIVGTKPPPTGPPGEVVDRYIQLEGEDS